MKKVIQAFYPGGMRPNAAVLAAVQVNRPALGAPLHRVATVQPKSALPHALPLRSHASLQTRGGGSSFEIDPGKLGLTTSGGQPLPVSVLAKMELAFGANFKNVKVHVGPQASRIGASAFTMGNDVFFAPGQYQPDSMQGQQLIGHELAHVIQQRQGRVHSSSTGIAVVHDHALEAEADRLGARAANMAFPMAVGHHQMAQLKKTSGPTPGLNAAPGHRPAPPVLPVRSMVQRKTPDEGEPNMLGWKPPATKKTLRYMEEPRLGIAAFNKTWKELAIKKWKENNVVFERKLTDTQSMMGARVHASRSGSETWVPWDGTGIDHKTSADELGKQLWSISNALEVLVKNSQPVPKSRQAYFSVFSAFGFTHLGWGATPKAKLAILKQIKEGNAYIYPTQWGASAYYHDYDNLVPLLSRDNSSKGASKAGKTFVPTALQNELMQQTYKLSTDIQYILYKWDGGKVTGALKKYMEGVRGNLLHLHEFMDNAINLKKIDDSVHKSVVSSYKSPIRLATKPPGK